MGHTPRMAQNPFDDPGLLASMSRYLSAATALEEAAELGGEARDLVDLAEAKALSGLMLRKRLGELGWSPPPGSSALAPRNGQSRESQSREPQPREPQPRDALQP